MVRTQIQLTEEQVVLLKQLAAKEHTSMAEIIRRAVMSYTSSPETGVIAERKKRALDAAGAFRSGCSDVSEHHDDYLAGALK